MENCLKFNYVYSYVTMDIEKIIEIRDMLEHAFESRNWGFVEEAIEVLNENLDDEYKTEEDDDDDEN